jgi:hypothetical protein
VSDAPLRRLGMTEKQGGQHPPGFFVKTFLDNLMNRPPFA